MASNEELEAMGIGETSSKQNNNSNTSRVNTGMPSDKDWLTTLLLSILTGVFGIHRFYVGKIGTGILYLLTLGCFGIGAIIDIIMVVMGKFTDVDGNIISNTKPNNSNNNNSRPYSEIGQADEIIKYKQLLDSGVITQEEFEQKKKQLLNL